MRIRKYQGETEEQVIEMAKQELGNDAIVLSIKKVTPTGIFSVIKKPYIELTASYDERKINLPSKIETSKQLLLQIKEKWLGSKNSLEDKLKEKDETIKLLEKRLKDTQEYLETAMKGLSKADSNKKIYKNDLVQFVYEILLKQGILPGIAKEILDDIDIKKENTTDLIIKIVYNKILKILKVSETTEFYKDLPKKRKTAKNIVFLGNTGVGKTTTIAKISSNLFMKEKLKISFITADTYRIAAVSQLKTYAEILGASVEVVYDSSEVKEKFKKLSNTNDLIFFDTAGRSHKNEENMKEIEDLLKEVKDPYIFLVLNSTMRFEDIMDIIKVYEKFTNFNIIFTKIDETNTLGTILNVSYLTKKKISYVTIGQNVPNDIEVFSSDKVTKEFLRSMYK